MMSKQERFLARNYNQLEKEVHVSYILRNLRTMKSYVKDQVTKEKWPKYFAQNSRLKLETSTEEEEDNATAEKIDEKYRT